MRTKVVLLLLAAVALFVVGCQNDVVGPAVGEKDLQAIKELIASEPLFTSDREILNDGDAVSFSILGKTTAPIYPMGWGRRITSVSREVTFDQVSDTVVVATITHTLTGEVKIRAKYSLSDTSFTLITKPFTEQTVRKVKFYRVRRTDDPKRNWQPREVSGTAGGTQNANVVINRLEVIVGTDTLVITNPIDYFLKLGKFGGREVPVLGASTPIKVRVSITSTETDTDFVSLHRPGMMMMGLLRPALIRMQLVQQTQVGSSYERVYEHSWTGHFPGKHHIFVSALTRPSLFDDVAPFSTKLWGVPYIVQ